MSEQEAAVEHLTRLLERDQLTVDEYRVLVDRVLTAGNAIELADALGDLVPTTSDSPAMVLECDSGVMKECPTHLPDTVEIRCLSGVMKIDLSKAVLDSDVTDVDIEVNTGVVKVKLPRNVIIETGDHTGGGGVTKLRVRPVSALASDPRIVLHVRNERGVLKVSRAWR